MAHLMPRCRPPAARRHKTNTKKVERNRVIAFAVAGYPAGPPEASAGARALAHNDDDDEQRGGCPGPRRLLLLLNFKSMTLQRGQ